MKVLVCGSRNFLDMAFLSETLQKLHQQTPFTLLIEGEARGADSLARNWALQQGIEVARFPADWKQYGKAAGSIRNKQMLVEGRPELVVGFSYDIANSRGTANMLAQARKAGIPTLFFGR